MTDISNGDNNNGEIKEEEETMAPDSPPAERRADGDVIENLEKSLDANAGIESDYPALQARIRTLSVEHGKTFVFTDPEFKAEASSLYYSSRRSNDMKKIEWKRPYELSETPRLLKSGISTDDIQQGALGNCWWLSSCAAIAREQKFMNKIVPKDHKMTGSDYLGMFHFRFWRFGSWIDVVVDDKLPTMNGRLVFGHSGDVNEFWLPLLEKAYAKLHTSYEAIEGGKPMDALEDLTGGLAISYLLGDKAPKDLFHKLLKAFTHKTFACASISGRGESVMTTGLVSAHAYTITGAKMVNSKRGKVELVRIRNPWGNKVEWKGDWSDDSELWNLVDAKTKKSLDYADIDNGEWWMTFEDFKKHFTEMAICTIGPDFDGDGAPSGDKWFLSMVKGEWVKGKTAGGSRNNVDKFATNPQYYMELKHPDDFDPDRDDPGDEGKCSVLMGLMQENRRARKAKGIENLYLQICIYKIDKKPTSKLEVDYFRYHAKLLNSGTYIDKREVTLSSSLEPGHYIIIPTSFFEDKPGSFLLRVFTERKIKIQELI